MANEIMPRKEFKINDKTNSLIQLDKKCISNLSYAVFMSLSKPTINNNSSIPLEVINLRTSDITLDKPTGTIKITTAGTFLFYWWFNIGGPNNVVSLVNAENQEVLTTSISPLVDIPIIGSYIKNITPNSSFQFINDSGSSRDLQINNASLSATVSIIQIG